MYLNRAILVGNLTRDPELRSLPSGIQISAFSIATNRVWKDKNGAKQEATDYHNVVVFGRQAETVSQYLRKGSSVLVEGRIQTRSWDGPDGVKKYRTEIVADRIQFGPRPAGGGVERDNSGQAPIADKGDGQASPEEEAIEYPEENVNIDDIPF